MDVISTEQKWVDSGIHISDRIIVTEINIISNKIDFCSDEYADFSIQPGKNPIILPFILKKGDSLNFSIIGSKICKDYNGEFINSKKIDESCNENEIEYFGNILNQEKCIKILKSTEYEEYMICPNKFKIGNSNWLSGQEYWDYNFLKLDQDLKERKIKNIIKFIKQNGRSFDCSSLSDDQKFEFDTHILNMLCGNICKSFYYENHNFDCVYIESNNIEDKIFRSIIDNLDSIENKVFDTKFISNILNNLELKTYIPLLSIYMDSEKFKFFQKDNGLYTNYNYKIINDHHVPKLIFNLGNNKNGIGGYNIRIKKIPNLENNLYINISDRFPDYNPGENDNDISINISKINDYNYMEELKNKLKGKKGTIYYGIRDHGCNYRGNKGSFTINLTTKEPPIKTFSIIYNFFEKKIKTAFFGSKYQNQDIIRYKSVSNITTMIDENLFLINKTKTIRSIIVSILLLYIILYTIYYFLGLSHVSIYEFLIISTKIGIITQLLQDNSWNFFYNNAFSIFISIPRQLIEVANFRGDDISDVFEFLDLPLNRFLSPNSILLIISLIFSGPLGIISFFLVIIGLIILIISIFNALLSFIVSIVIVTLLLSLAPIFIICLLFMQTRYLFHNWIKNLARFAIHPIVLLIFISLISQAMDYIIYSVFDFEVCSSCILNIKLNIFEFCILYGYTSKYTANIGAIISFVILGHIMKASVEASSRISDSLFGTYVLEEPVKQYQQNLMEIIGLDQQSIYRRKIASGIYSQYLEKLTTKKFELPQQRIKTSKIDIWKKR